MVGADVWPGEAATIALQKEATKMKLGSKMYHPAEPTVILTVVAIDGEWVTVRWITDGLPQTSSWLLSQLRLCA